MNKCHLIVSNFNKNLCWLNNLENIVSKIFVYDHDTLMEINEFILNNKKYYYEQIPNKGCEASAYLKYIIDNYDNLPDKIILIHDTEYSWHHTGSIIDLINDNINTDKLYINLNHYRWGHVNTNEEGYIDQFTINDTYYNIYEKILYKYFGDIRDYGNFLTDYLGCSQFIIKKLCILKNDKQLYIDLYNYCMSDNVLEGHYSGGFGYFMEYIWNIIFGYKISKDKFIGSWKYSARYVHYDNENIYAELGNGNGLWIPTIIPITDEYLYYNYFGTLKK